MADLPKYEDKVIAGPGGVILYSYSNGETWNWDNKPVRLSEGDYLPATGNFSNNTKLGLMYEVYIWRVEGSSRVYRTKEEARKGVGLIVNLSKIVREQKWVVASQVRVDFNTANVDNTPDPGSPVTQEKTEQQKIEEELKSQVYDRNPNQIKHSVLVRNAEGKWMLIFPNGYTVEYSAFMKLTTLERQNAAALDTKTGLVPNPTGTKTGDTPSATFPTWAYAVVGALVVAIMGLFMLSKPKSSKK